MKKTLKVGVWKDVNKEDAFYYVERSRHLGRTTEAAHRYNLTKEEFEEI